MGGWITLGVVILLAVLPIGVRVRYDEDGILVQLILGPLKITVFPRPKKETKQKKQIKANQEQKKAPADQNDNLPQPPKPPKQPKQNGQEKKKGGSLLEFLPLVKEVLCFLNVFRRKLRLNHLQLKLIMAGDDPCDLAVNYGRAWAAVGNLLPQLERIFVIKKRDIEVECDFTAMETLVVAGLDLTITLGRLLAAVMVFAVRALVQYLKIMNKRKGGAVK